MKIALLGVDAESLELVRWAAEHGGHKLVAAYDSAPWEHALQPLLPRGRQPESWEELLLGAVADAVIVGRGGSESAAAMNQEPAERRADQLRKLVQAVVPLIVVCPACEAIVGFEIEMIRSDTGSIIVPFSPGASHPAIEQLVALVNAGDSSPIGTIEQMSIEREQIDRSRPAVLVELARDVGILRRLLGTVRSVSASGPAAAIGRDPLGPKPKELPSLSNLSVHLGGDEGKSARWSIVPALTTNSARLTIIGQRGKALLTMPAAGDWSLQISGGSVTNETFHRAAAAEACFWQLSQAKNNAGRGDEDSAWLNACRDQEAAEAVDRSLARGRTIELFNEQHTEEASFKGIMAMGGCLLLMMTLCVVMLATVIEGLRLPMRNWPAWRLWPFFVLVPMGVFLLLQLLQFAAKRDTSHLNRLAGHSQPGS